MAVNGGTYASLGGVVAGDYTAGAEATTAITIGDPTTLGGTASLDGAVLLAGDDDDAHAGRHTLIQAGNVAGEFATIEYDSNFFWSADLGYASTEVDLPVGRAVVGRSITSGEIDADILPSNSKMENSYTGVSLYGFKPFGQAYLSGVLG